MAHVDHGKTTLVDALFRSSLGAKATEKLGERAMDTGDLEKERGITILSKVTALQVEGKDGDPVTLNIVDTPGHADFGPYESLATPQPDRCHVRTILFRLGTELRWELGSSAESGFRFAHWTNGTIEWVETAHLSHSAC